MLLRVLRLLVGTAHTCGYGRTDSADTRVRQIPPPLASPEAGGRVDPRIVQGTRQLDGLDSGDPSQPAPRRSGTLPSDRVRPPITLRDFMPAERTFGPHLGVRDSAAPDPIAWRASVLTASPAPPQPSRVVVAVTRQPSCRPVGKRKQQWAQYSRPEIMDAPCRLPSQQAGQPVTLLSVEQPQQPEAPRPRAPLPASISLRNFFGPLTVDVEDEIGPDETDHHQTPQPLTGHGRRSLPESRGRRDRQQQAHGPRAPQQSGRRRQRKVSVATEDSTEPVGNEKELAAEVPQPTARSLGDLSDRPEFQGHRGSAPESGVPPARRMGGWSMPRTHPRSAASALHAVTEEGPVSSRIQSEEADRGGLDSQGDPGTRGGTAHRSVRWGRPSAHTNFTADSAPGASAESAHGTDVRPPGQSRAGRPFGCPAPPPLAAPEGGELMLAACEARAVPVGAGHSTSYHRHRHRLEWTCMQRGRRDPLSHLPV